MSSLDALGLYVSPITNRIRLSKTRRLKDGCVVLTSAQPKDVTDEAVEAVMIHMMQTLERTGSNSLILTLEDGRELWLIVDIKEPKISDKEGEE